MQRTTILAVALTLAGTPVMAQVAAPAPAAKPAPATTGANPAHIAPAKAAAAPASTPEQRSAAALALSHEPTFDEGTAARIKKKRPPRKPRSSNQAGNHPLTAHLAR
jgi:hypothetical protein